MTEEHAVRRAPQLSRRRFLRHVGIASLVSFPAIAVLVRGAPPARAVDAWVAYHDRTGAEHQAEWDRLYPLGYRIISLSVYGDPAQPRYAAVWVRRDGPPWVGIHNATAEQYQAFFDTWAAQGFGPTILSVAGSGSNLVFAGVSEQISGPIPLTRFGLMNGPDNDDRTIEYWNRWARENNFLLHWTSIYGTAVDRRYAGVWVPNAGDVNWNNDGYAESAADYQARFDAQTSRWARPAFVTLSTDQRYLSHFRDDQIGSWVARHAMTSSDYQTETETWAAQGLYPICVQGGGAGAATRFAAIFAGQETPIARQWTATGVEVPALAAIDNAMHDFLLKTNTRAASVAVVRDKRLVFARAYTWAEPDYPIIQPTSLFRIASCSKPITAIAIMQLVERGLLNLDDRVQSILNVQPPALRALDPRFADIRVWQLLCHMGGWDRTQVYDLPTDVAVARAFGRQLPVDKYQVASYQAGQPLQFDPGSAQIYSNFGFSLLGLVIEQLRPGWSYIDSVRDRIFTPLGVMRPRLAVAPLAEQAPEAVRQHDAWLQVGRSVMAGDPNRGDQPLAPLPYGVENYRNFDSFGGWVLAAPDYARVLAAFHFGVDNPLLRPETIQTMWTVPAALAQATNKQLPNYMLGWDSASLGASGRVYSHGGGMPGVSTFVWHRTDGTSVVVFCNSGAGVPDLNAVVGAIPTDAWPAIDLFPSVGIPAFDPATINLARNKPASQSSTVDGGTADRAVDGNTDGNYANGSVTHTDADPQAWWQVDLGAIAQIERIDVYNRADCCAERLSDLYILISDDPFVSTDLNAARGQSGVSSYALAGGGQVMSADISRAGRYVRVQLAGTNYLSLAEVQVWGSVTPTSRPRAYLPMIVAPGPREQRGSTAFAAAQAAAAPVNVSGLAQARRTNGREVRHEVNA